MSGCFSGLLRLTPDHLFIHVLRFGPSRLPNAPMEWVPPMKKSPKTDNERAHRFNRAPTRPTFDPADDGPVAANPRSGFRSTTLSSKPAPINMQPMKTKLRPVALLPFVALPLATAPAAVLTWNGSPGDTWDTSTQQWLDDGANPAAWNSATPDSAVFASNGAGTVTVAPGISASGLTFDAASYTLQGSPITLAGTTPTIATASDATIASALAGSAGLTKNGTGTLTLTGTNTYSGTTTVNAGVLTFSGTAASSGTGASLLYVGGASGRGVMNLASTGTAAFGTATVNAPRIGGNDGVGDTGAGAVYQTSGTANWGRDGTYIELGTSAASAAPSAYGTYVLSGGTLDTNGGMRIGNGGHGVFHQSGGTSIFRRWFAIGASTGGSPSQGVGVVNITGGSATVTGSNRILICDRADTSGTLNIGTQAGGNGTLTVTSGTGITLLANASGKSAMVNVNSGTLALHDPLYRNGTTAGKIAVVNLNGGTIRANTGVDLITASSMLPVNVYNGGLTVDTQNFNASISANLLATTGNGIYPSGGILNLPSPAGEAYLGAPVVTVTTSGGGAGATAIANVANDQVTGVTLTCPGQGYAAGDTVTFTFAGGGAATPAASFVHALTAADLAANGAGGLTKLGAGTLTLTGNNTFAGPIAVSGRLVATTLNLRDTTLTLNGFTPNASIAPVEATSALSATGAVQVKVNGAVSKGTWPLIFYPIGGSIGGDGFAAFVLDTTSFPRSVTASLVDDNFAVALQVSDVLPLVWKGTQSPVWDIGTTSNWAIGPTAEPYLENDLVVFDDSVGAGPTDVALDVIVSPFSVSFENDTKDYTLSGGGRIAGTGWLAKNLGGTVTILTANTYSGPTTVNDGELRFGNGTANGGITGPLANEARVVFYPAGSAAYAGSISGSDAGTFVKTGSGTQVLTGSISSSGTFEVNEGTLQIGDGAVNGSFGAVVYQIAAGATLRRESATAAAPTWANINGKGTLALNTAQAVNGSADWGALALPAGFAGTLRVERGRVGANAGAEALGGTSLIQILPGAQLLNFTSAVPFTQPIEIAGGGWGEVGYPGGLRLAAGATATWAGPVTLTANSGIMAQRTATFTVTGAITGAFRCEFYAGDPVGDSGTLTIAPAGETPNSYASTRINGRPNGSIVAGNANAFGTGPLEVAGAILKLNGHAFTFASLSGTGGRIGNYHPDTPAALTVGTDGTDAACAAVLENGGAAPLALVKTGAGKLTLAAVNTCTGNTTVNNGTLELAENARLRFAIGDTSSVSNTLTGAGTAILAGDFAIDITAAAALTTGTWLLENVASLTGPYEPSFKVVNPDGSVWAAADNDQWTKTVGTQLWTFDETTGTLTLKQGGYESWAAEKIGDPAQRSRGMDPDGDGFTNLHEFLFGSEPMEPNGSLATITRDAGNAVTIRWKQRTTGATYRLLESATLANPWTVSTAAGGPDGAAAGDYQPMKAEAAVGAARNFFRVEGVEAN